MQKPQVRISVMKVANLPQNIMNAELNKSTARKPNDWILIHLTAYWHGGLNIVFIYNHLAPTVNDILNRKHCLKGYL